LRNHRNGRVEARAESPQKHSKAKPTASTGGIACCSDVYASSIEVPAFQLRAAAKVAQAAAQTLEKVDRIYDPTYDAAENLRPISFHSRDFAILFRIPMAAVP
jgi:hypothetical protein